MTFCARRTAGLVLLAAAGSSPAIAAGVWDFSGSVGFNAGRADNPRFNGRRNPNYDPNDSICTDPTDPAYDPSRSICTNEFLSASSRRADMNSALRATGRLSAVWDRTKFDIAYSPTAYFYYQRSYLNDVGQDLVSNWRHSFSPRSSMFLNEYFTYTPEQDLDPNSLQQNNVITQRTSRTYSAFRGSFSLQKSTVTTLSWTYRNTLREFSSPALIDSVNHNAAFQWKRQTGRRSFVTSGYDFGLYSFGRAGDSQSHQTNVGYGFESPRGLKLGFSAGYNLLLPGDPNARTAGGFSASSTLGWGGPRLASTLGYTRGFTDGGGAFANARTESLFADLRFTFTPKLSANLTGTRVLQERVQATTAAATRSEAVRSLNGRSALTYRVSKNLGLNASYAHYRQSEPTAAAAVPVVRSNRYTLGMTWSFR